ncbi:MAG: hypothetical protein GX539_11615 [Candidatus Cloacimonetes bacterium]|nr:hypothetical protein [Candidatus Cloacimonadota bacterium]
MMPSDTKSASRALFRTRRLVIPALVIAVGTFVACEGDNLFKPDNEAMGRGSPPSMDRASSSPACR